MSIELKRAAQQAVDAFHAFGDADDFASLFELTKKMCALRTAIQQAGAQQPATGEPVAWMASYVDPVGNERVYVTSHHDLAVENDMHGTPRPLVFGDTHPASSVPDDDFDLICNAIDKADTITMEGGYMLDSDDCIAVVRVMQVLLSVRTAMLAAKEAT